MPISRPPTFVLALAALAASVTAPYFSSATVTAQTGPRQRALASLVPASTITFPGETDSNSPAFWQNAGGVFQLVVINSSPNPILSVGPNLSFLRRDRPAVFDTVVSGPRWIEAVVPDEAGRLYGFYHNEPAGLCENTTKTVPRIGAARSVDAGRTWVDLGFVLETPLTDMVCHTDNRYFAGGVGDFSVIRDVAGDYLYFLYSAYGSSVFNQGVAAARMLWADRDEPRGRVATWSREVWTYPEPGDAGWIHIDPSPIFPVRESWHSPRGTVDAFWGPSVHWNTFLNRYVMLLNHASNVEWAQEGIYVSTTTRIDAPSSWSAPQKILDGGRWYPQVVGFELGAGTDRLAGERARFFMGGVSEHEIVFNASTSTAVPRE